MSPEFAGILSFAAYCGRTEQRFFLVSVRRALPDSSAAFTVRDGRHQKKEGWSSATFISQADMELLKRALP